MVGVLPLKFTETSGVYLENAEPVNNMLLVLPTWPIQILPTQNYCLLQVEYQIYKPVYGHFSNDKLDNLLNNNLLSYMQNNVHFLQIHKDYKFVFSVDEFCQAFQFHSDPRTKIVKGSSRSWVSSLKMDNFPFSYSEVRNSRIWLAGLQVLRALTWTRRNLRFWNFSQLREQALKKFRELVQTS